MSADLSVNRYALTKMHGKHLIHKLNIGIYVYKILNRWYSFAPGRGICKYYETFEWDINDLMSLCWFFLLQARVIVKNTEKKTKFRPIFFAVYLPTYGIHIKSSTYEYLCGIFAAAILRCPAHVRLLVKPFVCLVLKFNVLKNSK